VMLGGGIEPQVLVSHKHAGTHPALS
jgi:hypothetical protein